jgi:hypothetical protein
MSDSNPKPNYRLVIVIILILAVFVGGYLLYKSYSGGGTESCSSLRTLYESAKATENYTKVSEYFSKMNALGCK